MDWQEEYRNKLIEAEKAAAMVKSGDRIVFTMGREAFAVGLAIAARMGELKDVKLFVPTPGHDFGWYGPDSLSSFEVTIRMPTATCQEAVDNRLCDFDPGMLIPYVEVPENQKGAVVVTEVSSPDEHGFCSFGASLWGKKRELAQARLKIAEVNPSLIRTFGDNFVHVSEIDYFVEHVSSGAAPGTGSLAGRALKEPEPYLRSIAGYVTELVRDKDTIQIGVGRSTEPLVNLGILEGKYDIGFHSEATPPGVITRVKEGIITGKYKTLNPGKAVVTSIGGSTKEEMDWVNNNPAFYLVDIAYLEDMRVIAAHDNFVAINNALLIDLIGQVGSQSIGTRQLSSAGGQIPFVIGAWLSKGGRSITVLPSTARNGTVSRIMPTLPEGTIVTIQTNCTDYVVTEYGIARLRGKTFRERAHELIGIAHPDFRAELTREARKMFWP